MPKRTQLTDAEREQRRAAERAFVQQAVEQLRSSDGWQRWLDTRRHFHTYSLIISGRRCRRLALVVGAASMTCRRWCRGGWAAGGSVALGDGVGVVDAPAVWGIA
jgi:hypothetical protein